MPWQRKHLLRSKERENNRYKGTNAGNDPDECITAEYDYFSRNRRRNQIRVHFVETIVSEEHTDENHRKQYKNHGEHQQFLLDKGIAADDGHKKEHEKQPSFYREKILIQQRLHDRAPLIQYTIMSSMLAFSTSRSFGTICRLTNTSAPKAWTRLPTIAVGSKPANCSKLTVATP